ncbi:hypothetical protein MMJ63_23525, partial [Bacillus vallismortis]|nr:hypothetical protein [Bacillus vallismortis]
QTSDQLLDTQTHLQHAAIDYPRSHDPSVNKYSEIEAGNPARTTANTLFITRKAPTTGPANKDELKDIKSNPK